MILGTKLEEKNIVWSTKPRGDKVFFDYKHKLLMFLRDNMLEFLPFYPTDFSLPQSITIPEPNNKNKDYGPSLDDMEIRSIGISFTFKMIAISRRPNLLEFFDPLAMSRFLLYKLPPASTLILFDWLRKSKSGNFFLVSTGGVQIVQLEEGQLTVKKGANTSSPVVNAWYDGVKQFLAVNFLDSPDELKVFDFNKVDDGINFKQPLHQVSLKLNEIGGSLPVFNTNSYYERSKKTEESNASVVIDFINLYKECYLLHINSEMGTLTLHEIGGTGIKTVKILAESRFRYNIVDNLLIIHYLFEQITSVIDVRKESGINIIFGAPRCVSFMIEDIFLNDLMNFCNYIDQDMIEVYKEKSAPSNTAKELLRDFYEVSTINLDSNLTINTKKKIIMGLSVDLKEVLNSNESDVEKFCFLFRRTKSKIVYSNYLRNLISQKEKISILRPIFNKILENYRIAKNEIKSLHQKMKLTSQGINIDSYSKLNSGESFMKMKEFYEEVLNPIKDELLLIPENQNYLLQTLMSFVSIALEKKLIVEQQIEDILFRLFLKTRNFHNLHQMVQNSVISDRLSVSLALCELGSIEKKSLHDDPFVIECVSDMGDCYYMPAFQLGIDMLNRVRLTPVGQTQQPLPPTDESRLQIENLIFTYHVRNFKILECLELLETKHIKLSMGNLECLLIASNDPRSNYSFKKLIIYFSMKQTRDRILGSNDKFDEIVNRIVKQTEFMKALTAE